MNIIICVKQVPKTESVKLKAGASFSPEGLDRHINTFDTFAIEEALRIKDLHEDTKIILLTMGPKNSIRCLIEGLSLGADKAYHLDDENFSFHDTVSTSKTLAEAIKEIERTEGPADLIIAGNQSTDSGCGLVPIMLSEILSLDLVTSVVDISLSQDLKHLDLVKRGSNDFTSISSELPLIISMTKGSHEVRFPTFKMIREANRAELGKTKPSKTLTGSSSTKVLSVIKPGRNSRNAIVNMSDAEEGSAMFFDMLEEDSIFKR